MANIRMIFQGTERSETNEASLEVFHSVNNEIFISIEDNYPQHICLDKKTAVRFVREIKRQIGLMDEIKS